MEAVTDFIFLGSNITEDSDCSHEIKRCLLLGRKSMKNLDNILKIRDITFLTMGHRVKAMVFFGSHVWIWELCHKENWVPRNWCFQIVVLEKTLKNLLDFKEIKPVDSQGHQPWIFIRKTFAEAPIRLPPDAKNQLIGKDDGKDWRQKEKREAADEMVR